MISSWAHRAAALVQKRLSQVRHPWVPHRRGLWLTGRVDYRRRALPSAFEVRIVQTDTAPRRVAMAPGVGRPILIVPGLYADLDEGLFVEIADAARRTGRPVVLVEDRLAAQTLRATGGEVPELATVGAELGAIARTLHVPPDVLALSVGVAVALSAPADSLHRLVGWSGTVDPAATAVHLGTRPIVRWYFDRTHARAFDDAGLPALPASDVRSRLATAVVPPPALPTVLIHAADDPVTPVAPVQSLQHRFPGAVFVSSIGGHLGFGVLAGDGFYAAPLGMDGDG